jgi:hypothetical protein
MDENEGEHAGFEANVFLQKTLASNAPTILKDVMFCRGRPVPALIIRVLQEPLTTRIIYKKG